MPSREIVGTAGGARRMVLPTSGPSRGNHDEPPRSTTAGARAATCLVAASCRWAPRSAALCCWAHAATTTPVPGQQSLVAGGSASSQGGSPSSQGSSDTTARRAPRGRPIPCRHRQRRPQRHPRPCQCRIGRRLLPRAEPLRCADAHHTRHSQRAAARRIDRAERRRHRMDHSHPPGRHVPRRQAAHDRRRDLHVHPHAGGSNVGRSGDRRDGFREHGQDGRLHRAGATHHRRAPSSHRISRKFASSRTAPATTASPTPSARARSRSCR